MNLFIFGLYSYCKIA